MTTKSAINGLDSGGQGWSTAIMQSQPHSLGEPPETSHAISPRPEWIGEPVFGVQIIHVPTGKMVRGVNGEMVPQTRGIIPGYEHVRHVEPPRPSKNGFVYFIGHEGGLIKIGFSTVPHVRLRTLQLSSPVPLCLMATVAGTAKSEREYHAAFAEHRQHGEWFSPAYVIRREIERLNRLTNQ